MSKASGPAFADVEAVFPGLLGVDSFIDFYQNPSDIQGTMDALEEAATAAYSN